MVFWHSVTNNSCAEGRGKFTRNSNKYSGSKATPKELIQLLKNSSLNDLSNKLEEYYSLNK